MDITFDLVIKSLSFTLLHHYDNKGQDCTAMYNVLNTALHVKAWMGTRLHYFLRKFDIKMHNA